MVTRYVPIESFFLYAKSIGASNPIQYLWFYFNTHDPVETLSCDKLTDEMEEGKSPGSITWLKTD